MRKSERTHAAIVECAFQLVTRNGFAGLTIGTLAELMQMSKSGVFVRFGSLERLQLDVLQRCHREFTEQVTLPSLEAPEGLPRLHMLFHQWAEHVCGASGAGRIYLKGAMEFDADFGVVRDELTNMIEQWQDVLRRNLQRAIERGELPATDDVELLAFEIHGLMYAIYLDSCFLCRPGAMQRGMLAFERVIDRSLQDIRCRAYSQQMLAESTAD